MKIAENKRKPSYEFFNNKINWLTTENIDISVYKYIKDNNVLDDTAIYYHNKAYSYRWLFDLADRIAGRLWKLYIRPGDLVLVMMESSPIITALLLAASKIGVSIFSFTPETINENVEDVLKVLDTKLFFCMEKHYGKYAGMSCLDRVDEIIIIPTYFEDEFIPLNSTGSSKVSNFQTFNEFINGPVLSTLTVTTGLYPLNIMSTSGSTGRPKGIVLTNSNHIALTRILKEVDGFIKKSDRMLSMVPAFVATGISFSMLAPLALGAELIQIDELTNEELVNAISNYQPSVMLAPKSTWLALPNIAPNLNLSCLRNPLTFGEPIFDNEMVNLKQYLENNYCPKIPDNMYGLSECNSLMTGTQNRLKTSNTSAGFALPFVCVSVLDIEKNCECNYNEIGELCILSPSNMERYHLNAKATKEFFFEDEEGNLWARSGDVGYIKENNEIFICCRKKEQYLDKSGHSIYPFQIDNELAKLDYLARTKTLKVIINGREELCVFFIPATADNSEEVAEKIRKACRQFDVVPKAYKCCSAFPLNSGGKMDMVLMSKETEFTLIVE